MYLSKLFIPITKDLPSEAKIKSHQLMLRVGMIKQSAAGIYSWLPLGFKVMKKIEQIVREEQNLIGAQEMLMPTIQSSEIWKESGRYEDYGEEMLRIKDRKNLSINGYLEITLIVSNNGKIKKPVISFKGIPHNSEVENFIFDMEDEIFNICRTFSLESKNQEKNLIEIIKQNCRKIVREKTGKKPFTNINIARI